MTTNRLARSEAPAKRTPLEWCNIGNARLRGEVAYSDGEIRIRNDIHWVLRDGFPTLEWKR